MDDNVQHISSPASSANEHTIQNYVMPEPEVGEPTTSNGHFNSNARKVRAEMSETESTRSTSSETSSENDERDELYEYIYFDEVCQNPINQATSRQHEVQTAPLFTTLALEYINLGDKVNGIQLKIREY
jgi:hypothetical protein